MSKKRGSLHPFIHMLSRLFPSSVLTCFYQRRFAIFTLINMISKHYSCQPFTWCYFDLMSDPYGKISLFFQGKCQKWLERKKKYEICNKLWCSTGNYHSGMKTGVDEDIETSWVWPNIHLNQDSSCELSLSKPGMSQSTRSFLVLSCAIPHLWQVLFVLLWSFLVLAIFLGRADWTCPQYSKCRFFPFCHSTMDVPWFVLSSFNNTLIYF